MTTRFGATCLVLVCGFALLAGCGGKEHASGFVDTGDHAGAAQMGHAGAGGSSGGSTTGGTGGTTVSVLAPNVQITTPTPASDPNADAVLIEDQVTVLCSVIKSTAPGSVDVDASSVKIAMVGADGKELKSSAGAPTANDSEYSASFALGSVPSGLVSFRCAASDKASTAHESSTTVDTLVDHGPEISIVEPADLSAHNLLGVMAVEFDTAPVLIAEGDKQADVSAVTLTVYGAKIPTTGVGAGKYKATVDFSDKAIFGAPPTGKIPVVLTATNKRKAPGKATQSVSYSIVLDGTGPSIALASPVDSAVVGRASVLTFTVTDVGSGVDNDTVTVKLNDTPYVFSGTDGKWTVDTTGLYTFQFGAELLARKGDTQVTVNLFAKDKAGNASPSGKSIIYHLDNQPPIVDMNPPNLYEAIISSPTTKQCSDYFDPLGSAPSDLDLITNFGKFRALVYDNTNSEAGQTAFYFALTNRAEVQIFVQYDKNSPLLADDDGDHVCDEIWTGSMPHQKKPTDKPIPYLGLKPVLLNSYRGSVTYPDVKVDSPLGIPCTGGAASSAPKLCLNGSSDMSVVIHHGVGKDEPVIYAISPIDNNQMALCTGDEWNVSTAISAVNTGDKYLGWVCVAARAVDNVGNPGISAPLRLCLDDGTNPHRCDAEPPPSCADDCTPPKHFNAIVAHD